MKPTDSPSPHPPRKASAGHGPGPNFPYDDHSSASGSSPASSSDELHNDDVAHEHSDINVRAIVMSSVVIFVVCAATAVLVYGLFWYVLEPQAAQRDPKLSPLAMPSTTMPATTRTSPAFGSAPEPRLLTNEPANLLQLREREQQQLGAYGWMDEKAGIARIPIEEAKKLVIERGLPVRPDPVTDPRQGTRAPAYGESSSGRNITRAPAADPQPPAAAPAPAPAAPAHKGH
jgi:hypothetical protein